MKNHQACKVLKMFILGQNFSIYGNFFSDLGSVGRKKSSENDQLTGHFQSFFSGHFQSFFYPEKKTVKLIRQTNSLY